MAEAATEVAQEVAAEAEQGEPSDEKSEAAHEFVCCSKMQKFRREHPDAVVIGRKENICSTFKDDAMLVLKLSVKLPSFSLMVRHTTSSRLSFLTNASRSLSPAARRSASGTSSKAKMIWKCSRLW